MFGYIFFCLEAFFFCCLRFLYGLVWFGFCFVRVQIAVLISGFPFDRDNRQPRVRPLRHEVDF